VRLDRFLSKLVTVEPTLRGEPHQGYEVDPSLVQVKPQSVWIEGPYNVVSALEKVPTSVIDVGGLERDLRTEIPLETPRQRFVKYQTNRVTVEIPVRERIYETTFRGLPMRVVPCPTGDVCRVDPPTFEMRVLGKHFTLTKLDTKALTGMVFIRRKDVPGERGVFTEVKPSFENPAELIVHVQPESFRVQIEKTRDQRDERLRQPLMQERQ
jgi:hypothetical protein